MITASESRLIAFVPDYQTHLTKIQDEITNASKQGKTSIDYEIEVFSTDCGLSNSELIRSFLISLKYLAKILSKKDNSEKINISWE